LVSTRDVFSNEELAGLRGFPEISLEELLRYFTLTPVEEGFVGLRRMPATVLSVAVQLRTLPWLGLVPDDVAAAPPVVVARLASQLGLDLGVLAGYGDREQTRTDHLREVMSYAGWRTADRWYLRNWMSFCWSGRWNRIRRRCCFGWRVSI
jgi:hypothetical protein